MNIQLTNEWGAIVITCEHHLAVRLNCISGTVQQAPTERECPQCGTEHERAALPGRVRAALLSPSLSHTRLRNWCRNASVYIYHRDEASPSGVRLAEACDEPMYNAIAAELAGQVHRGALSPLSPTEGLYR